ncbi:hypothetical protein DFJ74DRAFT_292113 [Hyaloraphidium curvatum]|nr:hypothetical protein DFJ74DRAFT_292113 [Hyaloraphidium curvatum]
MGLRNLDYEFAAALGRLEDRLEIVFSGARDLSLSEADHLLSLLQGLAGFLKVHAHSSANHRPIVLCLKSLARMVKSFRKSLPRIAGESLHLEAADPAALLGFNLVREVLGCLGVAEGSGSSMRLFGWNDEQAEDRAIIRMEADLHLGNSLLKLWSLLQRIHVAPDIKSSLSTFVENVVAALPGKLNPLFHHYGLQGFVSRRYLDVLGQLTKMVADKGSPAAFEAAATSMMDLLGMLPLSSLQAATINRTDTTHFVGSGNGVEGDLIRNGRYLVWLLLNALSDLCGAARTGAPDQALLHLLTKLFGALSTSFAMQANAYEFFLDHDGRMMETVLAQLRVWDYARRLRSKDLPSDARFEEGTPPDALDQVLVDLHPARTFLALLDDAYGFDISSCVDLVLDGSIPFMETVLEFLAIVRWRPRSRDCTDADLVVAPGLDDSLFLASLGRQLQPLLPSDCSTIQMDLVRALHEYSHGIASTQRIS